MTTTRKVPYAIDEKLARWYSAWMAFRCGGSDPDLFVAGLTAPGAALAMVEKEDCVFLNVNGISLEPALAWKDDGGRWESDPDAPWIRTEVRRTMGIEC